MVHLSLLLRHPGADGLSTYFDPLMSTPVPLSPAGGLNEVTTPSLQDQASGISGRDGDASVCLCVPPDAFVCLTFPHRTASNWATCIARVFEHEITAGESERSPPFLAHEIRLLHHLLLEPLLFPLDVTLSYCRSGEIVKIEVITNNL